MFSLFFSFLLLLIVLFFSFYNDSSLCNLNHITRSQGKSGEAPHYNHLVVCRCRLLRATQHRTTSVKVKCRLSNQIIYFNFKSPRQKNWSLSHTLFYLSHPLSLSLSLLSLAHKHIVFSMIVWPIHGKITKRRWNN